MSFWNTFKNRVHEVPPPEAPSTLAIYNDMGVEMEVLPYKSKWEWRVRLTFGGTPSIMDYSMSHWSHPTPHEVRGRCRDQGEAWRLARAAADDARARRVARENIVSRTHKEHFKV